MTGWPLFAVFASVAGIGCFVAYWSGVGRAERRAAWRLAKAQVEVERLRQELVRRSIEEQVLAANAGSARLTAAEIDAWHELVCDLGDEAA